jgi:hypothetical protein
MKDTTINQRAAAALIALGDNAEQIAVTLLRGGWYGERHNSGACPIAHYLMTVLPEVLDLAVGSYQATLYTVSDTNPDIEIDLTEAVAGFVLTFDIGAYPELIAQHTAVVLDI